VGLEPDGVGMITGRDLREARRELRLRAGEEFPELLAIDKPGPSITAALRYKGFDVDDTMAFVEGTVRKNKARLAKKGLTTTDQWALFAAAIAYGIALGAEVSE
jgi:hypothetical protein